MFALQASLDFRVQENPRKGVSLDERMMAPAIYRFVRGCARALHKSGFTYLWSIGEKRVSDSHKGAAAIYCLRMGCSFCPDRIEDADAPCDFTVLIRQRLNAEKHVRPFELHLGRFSAKGGQMSGNCGVGPVSGFEDIINRLAALRVPVAANGERRSVDDDLNR